jgi:hypothetical protein
MPSIPPKRLRILHDGSYKLTYQNTVGPIYLRSNAPSLYIRPGGMFSSIHSTHSFSLPWEKVRHPPVSQYTIYLYALGRTPNHLIAQVSPSILLLIARRIQYGRESVWWSNLLNMGLVCRGWSTFLDHFFCAPDGPLNGLGRRKPGTPIVQSIVRSLQWKPERALLIQTLSIDLSGAHSEFFIDLLLLAKAVKHVEIKGVSSRSFPKLLSALQDLTALEEFTMLSDYYTLHFFTFADLLNLSASWVNLKKLRVTVGGRYTSFK